MAAFPVGRTIDGLTQVFMTLIGARHGFEENVS
jgi:hypothetical protein